MSLSNSATKPTQMKLAATPEQLQSTLDIVNTLNERIKNLTNKAKKAVELLEIISTLEVALMKKGECYVESLMPHYKASMLTN